MQWGKRGPGSPKRRRGAYRPVSEALETRRLLTTFDLTTTQTAPLGVEFVGATASTTSGFTVTDVGNVTGSGYDSFVVSAPGLPSASLSVGGRSLSFSGAGGSAAYLVFGSKQVNLGTVASYLSLASGVAGTGGELTSGNRAGDLGELGTLGVSAQDGGVVAPTAQTNPTVAQPQPPTDSTHVYGFNFDGLTFTTGTGATTGIGTTSALGFSVAALGDLNNDGYDDFAIGAPNDTGGGRVFVVYGGPALATQPVTAKTINLEPTAGTTTAVAPTKVVSFYDSLGTTGTDVGFSVAGLGNFFGTTSFTHDLAIGAPGLTVGGLANAGAVFTVSGNYINSVATGTSVDLNALYVPVGSTVTSSLGGNEYQGFVTGGEVGFSVASAGNSDGEAGTNGSAIDNLLIGAPGATAGGEALLVYGLQAYAPNQAVGFVRSLATLGVAPVTTPVATFPLQGAIFGDTTAGDAFGFDVATAGDFNGDGVDDLLIGAPGYLSGTGYVEVIYGLKGSATTTTSTRTNGIFVINPVTATAALTQASFIGEGIGDFAGYSISSSGHIQIGTATGTAPTFDIVIGAPGIQTAYLVPGSAAGGTAKTGTNMLSAINGTLAGNEFTVAGTADPAITDVGFGTSVNARNLVVDPNTGVNTVDPDSVPDLFFGAPDSSLNSPVSALTVERALAGVTYVVEGGLIGGTSTGTTGTTGTGTVGTTAAFSSSILINTQNPVVFTGDDFGLASPPISALSHLDSYAPLPVQIAEQQFRPQPGFEARQEVYHHPSQKKGSHQAPAGTVLNVAAIGHSENKYSKVNTLRPGIFKRGKTQIGKKDTFTHHSKVIPTNEQTETFPG